MPHDITPGSTLAFRHYKAPLPTAACVIVSCWFPLSTLHLFSTVIPAETRQVHIPPPLPALVPFSDEYDPEPGTLGQHSHSHWRGCTALTLATVSRTVCRATKSMNGCVTVGGSMLRVEVYWWCLQTPHPPIYRRHRSTIVEQPRERRQGELHQC